MRKILTRNTTGAGVTACMVAVGLCVVAACVNNIPGEDGNGDVVVEGKKVVTFTAEIVDTEQGATRATKEEFKQGDQIGLFAITPSGSLKGTRYVDNRLMEYQGNGTLTSESPLYYPDGGATMDIFCYYPYRPNGIPQKSSLLPVQVATDQSDENNFAESDFLVAQVNGVSDDGEPVALKFRHRLVVVEVVLVPGEGMNADELERLNPRLTGINFQTEGLYDPTTDSFSESSSGSVSDIVAHGEWKQTKGGNLEGKEIIVPPQIVGDYDRSFMLEIDGKVITSVIDRRALQTGTSFTFYIDVSSEDTGAVHGRVEGIEGWEDGGSADGTTTELNNAVHTSVFSFSNSNGYRVYHDDEVVAEVWREFLCDGAGVGSQALVAYPMKNGKCDLQEGLLLRYYGKEESTCGGRVIWNSNGSGYDYTGGSLPPIGTFYVTEDHELTVNKTSNVVSVTMSCYVLTDYRDNNLTTYPLVKIGTQIWMASNLRAEAFADGTPLELEEEIGVDRNSCYFKADGQPIYFYNGETLMNKEHTIAPNGFRIPTKEDWSQMQTYLYDDATVLKTGTWVQARDTTKTVTAATDLTWFRAEPLGMWTNEVMLSGQEAVFWSWDKSNDKPAKYFIALYGEETKFMTDAITSDRTYNGSNYYKAASVRCIKE